MRSSTEYINLLMQGLQSDPDQYIHQINELTRLYVVAKEERIQLIILVSNFLNANTASEQQPYVESIMQILHELSTQTLSIQEEKPTPVAAKPKQLIFEAINLNKSYEGNHAFKLIDLSMKLFEGEITAVVGENGNGKSTVCKIIAGLLQLDSGILRYPLFNQTEDDLDWLELKKDIVFLPQELQKLNGTVEQNLIFEGRVSGITPEDIDSIVSFYIQRLGLHSYRNSYWNELSGGYRLRLHLALCLIRAPRLLILDEPLGNLDIKAQADLLMDLRLLCNSTVKPLSIILTSQHIDEIEHIADNILYIEHGKALLNCKMYDIGNEQSCFELRSSTMTQTILYDLFKPYGLVKTYLTNSGQAILFEGSISFYEVNDILHKANHAITYLRDISNSSKKVFYFGI
jgi:ABC-2 type transport system ATP-binding protein